MPQLDQFTYLTQFLWLCVFFMSFYVLLYNDGLPKISRILKLRAKLVSQQSESTNHSDQNTLRLENQDTVIKESLNSCASYLNTSVSGASKWCNEMVASLNTNQLEAINKSYVRSLGEISVSQMIKRSVLDSIEVTPLMSGAKGYNQIYALLFFKQLAKITPEQTAFSVNVKTHFGPRTQKKKSQNA